MTYFTFSFRIASFQITWWIAQLVRRCWWQYISIINSHNGVIKWKHFTRYWPFVRGIRRSPVNSTHKGQWRGALMFPLICNWINGWVNNREAGDLRCHSAHYDVTVIIFFEANSSYSWWTIWGMCHALHHDVMTWNWFLHYCPFVRGIHWSVVSHHKGTVMWSIRIFFVISRKSWC